VHDGASVVGVALAYADVGRKEDALAALERAAEQPSLAALTVAVEPRLRPLAGTSRYRAVLERLNLASPRGLKLSPGERHHAAAH